jgi:thymidylate synthase (FAD)
VEIGARACYRSFKAGRPHDDHLTNLLESGHGSCLEHCVFTLMVMGVSRSLTHEFVRHRVGLSYSQESQRYVNATDARVVPPPDMVSSVLDYIVRRRASAELGVDLLDAEKWVGGVEQALSVYSSWPASTTPKTRMPRHARRSSRRPGRYYLTALRRGFR